MTTLVTGGAGFIGSHLAKSLLDDGEEVRIIDNLSTGDISNLDGYQHHPRLIFVRDDILNLDALMDLADGVDAIYHMAAAVGTLTILERPLESLRTNLHGSENVVGAAVHNQAVLLMASTSEVYGKNTAIGLKENDDRIVGSPLLARWSYAEAKAIDETLAYVTAMEQGLKTVIVRLFNTVGPRQTGRYGMVIPRFVAQAINGRNVTVYGSGNQVRCFCHVADVVPALRKLMSTPSAYGSVFNLGNNEQVTINQLAERVIELTNSRSSIQYVPYEEAYPPGFEDMERRVPNCERINACIGFEPTRNLDTIISDVISDQMSSGSWLRVSV